MSSMGLSVCSHCGSTSHDADHCTVKDATRRILEGYRPRGATAGFECPNGHGDGVWHWWPPTGAQGFSCEVCGAVVDHHTGERLDQVEQDRRLAERERRATEGGEVVEPPRRHLLARLRRLTSRGLHGR